MQQLEHPDTLHLQAAEGWLELGNHIEANEELERIRPSMRAHPFVLRVRWGIYAQAKRWDMAVEIGRAMSEMLPTNSWGFIQWAFSLHELKRTQEAKCVLLPIADKFQDDATIQYNLACYCCQLGELKESWLWLTRAIDQSGAKDIRLMALDDPDLEPLWNRIAEI
jgi:predicted Zn-dependent protease